VTRRILLAQVSLLVLLLLGAVVPLGLAAAAHDQAAFRASASGAARSLGTVAEDRLDGKRPTPQLPALMGKLVVPGDRAELMLRDGSVVTLGSPARYGVPVLRAALQGQSGSAWEGAGDQRRLLVGVPVGDQTPPVGAVLLSRTATLLDGTIQLLWLRLAGITAVAALAAAAAALTLSRWVSRPVRSLEAAARSLGNSDLAVRAPVDSGPQEVRQLATTFNAMAARLETVVHAHREVIADVSHQLRTPLTAIRLRLELLADETAGLPQAADVTATLAELARLSRLVDGLLDVARGENRATRPEPVKVDLVVLERADAWEPVADDAGVAIRSNTAGSLTAGLTPGHLEQVLDNLLDNAIAATPPGGTVSMDVDETARGIRLVVTDQGPGMSELQQAGAFRRFSGIGESGTGLGLAIVRQLITADGGQASISTADSGGLAVTLLLRRADVGEQLPTVPG